MNDTQKQIQELQRFYMSKSQSEQDSLVFYEQIQDINVVDEYNKEESLLHIAAFYGDAKAVKYLLKQGITVAVTDTFKDTPLHALARENRMVERKEEAMKEITELLLEAGVSPLRKNADGSLACHLAAQNANIQMLNVFIQNNIKMTMTDCSGNTVLHSVALGAGRNQADLMFSHDDESKKRIYLKETKYFEIARGLVNYGIDFDIVNDEEKKAYEIAAANNCGRIAIVLRGDYDESDENLQLKIISKGKCIHQAIKDGDFEAVKALILLGIDVNEVYQGPPFSYQTPLAVACMQMQCECVELLLKEKADPNFRTGEQERSAFYWMIKYCQYNQDFYKEKRLDRVLKAFVDAGLMLNAPVDENGNTAVGCAYSKSIVVTRDYSYGSFSELFVKTYLLLGADVNKKNHEGKTPLMEFIENTYYARDNGLLDLLENGADVSLKDSISETVLMKAARNRNHVVMVQMVDLMNDFGDLCLLDVNNEGKSAMDIASENNNEELVKWILNKLG